jgi:hypothetical protein
MVSLERIITVSEKEYVETVLVPTETQIFLFRKVG